MNDFLAVPPKTVLERELTNPASPARAALNATILAQVGPATVGKLDKTEATNTYTRKRGARVALLGDSITAGNYPTAGTTNATGYFVWANILLNSRMSPVFDADGLAFGYAGITANTLLNGGECAQAAASNADIVVEFSGTNDLTNGEANNTPAGIAASRLAMWQMLIAAGKQVVACTILPRRDNTALNASIRTANRLIRKNAMATPGVVLCDWNAALVDPTDGYSSTLYLRSDNLHVNAVGASRMGKLLADVLDKLIPTFGDSDLPTANGEGLINNSLMTGTGGTYFGNNTGFGTATGPVATGWTLGNSGGEGGSITGAKVARTDLWPGEWQQVTLATPPNPTADRMWLRGTSTGLGGAAVGDLVYAAVEFQTDAAGWDIRHIAVNVDFPGTAVLGKALDIASAYLTAQTVPIMRPASGVIKTLPVAIPAGATAVRVAINMYGSGTIRFGRTGVFKVV